MNWKILLLLISAVLLTPGCESMKAKKMPCNDVDVPIRFKHEIAILQADMRSVGAERKFRAARVLYQNVDFTFARDTDILLTIFGTKVARRAKVLDNETLVFQYTWNNQYIRFAFMGIKDVITHAEVKHDTIRK